MKSLVPSNLKNSWTRLREELDDAFNRVIPRKHGAENGLEASDWDSFSFAGPAINVKEDENEFLVTAELPGLDEKDFKIELSSGRLLISGEKKSMREEKGKECTYSECRYGSFSRSVYIPCEVDAEKVKADYKNGVLKVILPKTESSKSKKIKVSIL